MPQRHIHKLTLIKSPVEMQELLKDEPLNSSVLFPLACAALTESPSHPSAWVTVTPLQTDWVTVTPLQTNLAFTPV